MACRAPRVVLPVAPLLLACAGAPAASPAPQAAVAAAPSCIEDRELSYSRVDPDGSAIRITLSCHDDQIGAMAERRPAPPALASDDEEGDGDESVSEPVVVLGSVDVAVFNALWRATYFRIQAGDCGVTPTVRKIVLGTGSTKLSCNAPRQRLRAVEARLLSIAADVEREAPPPPKVEEFWQFDGEYWKEELGYYR